MGKITSIITFSGKLGNTVGSKGLRGRHLIRARQYDVKNPRSSAQNVQRMIFSTAATSLAYLTEILNNSFEGKAFGQESLSYARKVNLDLLRNMNPTSAISGGHFLKKGEKFFAPNEYILSQGTLVSPAFTIVDGADFSIKFDNSPIPTAALTASQLFPTVAVGDQITIISVAASNRNYRTEDEVGYTEVRYCRFAFKDDTTPALVSDGKGGFAINPAAIDLVKAKGDWKKLTFAVEKSGLVYTQGMHSAEPAGLMAAAVLVSNLENNRRSNSRMAVLKPASVLYDWLWHGGDAYPTYGNVAAEQYDFASDVYLNNSARRVAVGGDSESQSISATYEEKSLPASIGTTDGRLVVPVPSMPTSLRLNVRSGSAQQNTDNIIGAQANATVATFPDHNSLLVTTAAKFVDGTGLQVDIKASVANIALLGGTAVCDGVTYKF